VSQVRDGDGPASLYLSVPAQGMGALREMHQPPMRMRRGAEEEAEVKGRQIINGDTIWLRNGEAIHDICCDCRLSHLVIFRIVGKRIAMTVYRDDADTAKRRKERKR
jgi:hypothetical protein